MARKSKRKRDEKRFGRPERLVDMFGRVPWAKFWGDQVPGETEWDSSQRELVAKCIAHKTVDASNVARYVFDQDVNGRIGQYSRDIVNAAPPFPMCFVEFDPPDAGPQMRRMGWAIQAFDKGDEPCLAYEAMFQHPDPGLYEKCRWFILGSVCVAMADKPGPDGTVGVVCPIVQAVFMVGESGEALRPPTFSIPKDAPSLDVDWLMSWVSNSFYWAMYAFCFINCKNVSLTAVEPDRGRNRERERAGLKPFLRYHTINIEPMKEVLRTEGGIEANGLSRALHICRGHFATYTEERPLFGRPGAAGKFWVPAHTRGSHKSGVVVSDYRVNAPAAGAGS